MPRCTLGDEVFLKLSQELQIEQVISCQSLLTDHCLHGLNVLPYGITCILHAQTHTHTLLEWYDKCEHVQAGRVCVNSQAGWKHQSGLCGSSPLRWQISSDERETAARWWEDRSKPQEHEMINGQWVGASWNCMLSRELITTSHPASRGFPEGASDSQGLVFFLLFLFNTATMQNSSMSCRLIHEKNLNEMLCPFPFRFSYMVMNSCNHSEGSQSFTQSTFWMSFFPEPTPFVSTHRNKWFLIWSLKNKRLRQQTWSDQRVPSQVQSQDQKFWRQVPIMSNMTQNKSQVNSQVQTGKSQVKLQIKTSLFNQPASLW